MTIGFEFAGGIDFRPDEAEAILRQVPAAPGVFALFGAREVILDAAAHDTLVAWSSHLPQLASTALASVLGDKAPDAAQVTGPGLLDMTRLAMSSYDLWSDILDTNREAVRIALDAYIEKLRELRAGYETEFASGSAFAKSLRDR